MLRAKRPAKKPYEQTRHTIADLSDDERAFVLYRSALMLLTDLDIWVEVPIPTGPRLVSIPKKIDAEAGVDTAIGMERALVILGLSKLRRIYR